MEWFKFVTKARNDACTRHLQDALEASESGIDANIVKRSSKRSLHAGLEIADYVVIHMPKHDATPDESDTFPLAALYTQDFRQLVAFKLDESTINSVVNCIRASQVREKRPKIEPHKFSHSHVHWSNWRACLYTMYSDDDGVVHRKFRKPFKVRPSDDVAAERLIQEACDWLDNFYKENHKGPSDVVFPADLMDDDEEPHMCKAVDATTDAIDDRFDTPFETIPVLESQPPATFDPADAETLSLIHI